MFNHFAYRKGRLFYREFPVENLAEKFGTPLYIYDEEIIRENFGVLTDAFSSFSPLICYAMKANDNPYFAAMISKMGGGADVVSGGELFIARKAGVPADRIVFNGNGKTLAEIAYALAEGILCFNADSFEEAERIDLVAKKLRKKASLAFRVNPDVDPKTHKYIATGLKTSKFGIPIKKAFEIYRAAAKFRNIKLSGIHQHIGSQILDGAVYRESMGKIFGLYDRLAKSGIKLNHIDLGGGFGIKYDAEEHLDLSGIAAYAGAESKKRGVKIIFEPGRFIIGPAGALIARVQLVKKTAHGSFVVVDAGMNDLIRPAFYDAYHKALPSVRRKGAVKKHDIVGPICESGDFFAKGRKLSPVKAGDIIALLSAGAYGFAMSSNYNGRPRPAEVALRGGRARVIRRRESRAGLLKGTQYEK